MTTTLNNSYLVKRPKSVHIGGRGSKLPKILFTWFVHAPLLKKILQNSVDINGFTIFRPIINKYFRKRFYNIFCIIVRLPAFFHEYAKTCKKHES